MLFKIACCLTMTYAILICGIAVFPVKRKCSCNKPVKTLVEAKMNYAS